MNKCIELQHQFVSVSRMKQYENINEYFENLKLCKNYYIPLSLTEIALRNSLNNFFKIRVCENWIFDKEFIKPQHQYKIDLSIKMLQQKHKEISQDNIIAELSFGFFVTFFKQPYQQYFRYKDLKSIFPKLVSSKDKKINRHYVFTKLNKIRLFRNKVFHHNKIINKIEYQNMMNEISQILKFFDPELAIVLGKTNGK